MPFRVRETCHGLRPDGGATVYQYHVRDKPEITVVIRRCRGCLVKPKPWQTSQEPIRGLHEDASDRQQSGALSSAIATG
jgi:hypothetical protein